MVIGVTLSHSVRAELHEMRSGLHCNLGLGV